MRNIVMVFAPKPQNAKKQGEKMKKEVFADEVSQIYFAGGMIRIDFASLQPQEENRPMPEPCLRVVMPPEGARDAVRSLQLLLDKLAEDGILPPE